MPKQFSMFCADKERWFQRKHSLPFWMTSCCFPTIFLLAFFFFFSPSSYINSVSSSFRDRWWAGDTNELPAAQGRQTEMLCVLRTNRLSTLTEDVTHDMKGLMHKYFSRLFFSHAPMNCVSPREQLPKTAYKIVRSYCVYWGITVNGTIIPLFYGDGASIRLWTHGDWMPCFSGVSILRNKNKEHLLVLRMCLWTL